MPKQTRKQIRDDKLRNVESLFQKIPTPESRARNAALAGVKDSITRDLKQGIIDAATAHGADGFGAGGLTGYLFLLANEHPKTFASLLVKMLPLQVSGATRNSIGTVNVVSVPVDHYLSPDDLRKMTPQIVDSVAAANDDSASAGDVDADESNEAY